MRKLIFSLFAAAAALALFASFAPQTGPAVGGLGAIDTSAITLAGQPLEAAAPADAF